MIVLGMKGVTHGFGGPSLLDGADLHIESGERIGLLGRNGAGKSTLLSLLAGDLVPDDGEITVAADATVVAVPQEIPDRLSGTFRDFLRAAAGEGEAWEIERRVDRVLDRLPVDLPPDADVATQSAGTKRKLLLARALVARPDLLLLDEPTNHLDIDSIRELEELLVASPAALVFVTHDRAFLGRVATRILDLDRGTLRSYECDYRTYLDRKAAELEAEAVRADELEKKLAREEDWLARGVKARTTRNMGRVRALESLREESRERREEPGTVRAEVTEADRTGRKVIVAKGLTKAFGGEPIVDGLDVEILRGDRIGLLGPNGVGKTTLLRLLLGEIEPDAGTVTHGTRLTIAWLDQLGEELDEERSIRENLIGHGDRVTVGGRSRPVVGYLRDFLFTPDQIRSPVAALSGGERRRVQLARILSRPSNVLVLDEPTNDLDLETLDVLETLLLEFSGTLLLVSHDREFLDRVVTSTLAFEGDGRVRRYAGGWSDWLRQRAAPEAPEAAEEPEPKLDRERPRPRLRRRSWREERELEALPERIESLERERNGIVQAMADPEFFRRPGAEIAAAKERHEALQAEIEEAYARWEELEGLPS